VRTPNLFVAGLGAYLPDTLAVATAAEQGLCSIETVQAGWLAARVAGDMPAPDMAAAAGNQALENSGHQPADIDLLVHACAHHQGPDGWCPPQYVQRRTIGGEATAIGLSHSCNSMLTALELAANYLAADPARTAALLCTADNFGTPLFDRWRSHRAAVFSDIGSALVLSRSHGFARLLAVRSTSRPELEELSRGTEEIFPPSCTVGRPLDFEARFASYEGDLLQLAARLMPELFGDLLAQTLAEAGITREDLARVCHQFAADELTMKMALDPLGIPPEKGLLQLGRENGRSGASDQVLGLLDLIATRQLGPGDHVLLMGSGPGLIATCAVVRLERLPDPLPAPVSSAS
jgi:3-oxoacyl-[acyl-carrier-protein] synthase-3